MKYIYIYTFMYYQTQREFFFVSGNDHMWPEIGVRALFIAYLVHMGPTNIFMVRGYHMVDFKSFMELVS